MAWEGDKEKEESPDEPEEDGPTSELAESELSTPLTTQLPEPELQKKSEAFDTMPFVLVQQLTNLVVKRMQERIRGPEFRDEVALAAEKQHFGTTQANGFEYNVSVLVEPDEIRLLIDSQGD